MTYSAGPAVAMAAAQRAERKLIEALRVAGALSAETAVPLVPDRWFGRAALKRLLRRKAVHEVGGRYWLDEDGYAAMQDPPQGGRDHRHCPAGRACRHHGRGHRPSGWRLIPPQAPELRDRQSLLPIRTTVRCSSLDW